VRRRISHRIDVHGIRAGEIDGTHMKSERAFVLLFVAVAAIAAISLLTGTVPSQSPARLVDSAASGLRNDIQPWRATSTPPEFPPLTVTARDVRAVYLTAGVGLSKSRIDGIVGLSQTSRVNAVVINVKDGDGTYLTDAMRDNVRKLREAGVYPIARIVVFQDNRLAKTRPDLALTNVDGSAWGSAYHWVDPASREVWDGAVSVANRALAMGFAEVNFDYIRFPSDGDVGGIVYPVWDRVRPMTEVMNDFDIYLARNIRAVHPDAVLSADLFAYSFIQRGGLGVGQVLSDAARHFDVISPMIYPSHFAPLNFGIENPAQEPYQVVLRTLESGKALLPPDTKVIVRPWIQDFNMGATYDAFMVREEIRAIRDAGLPDAWMAWNPTTIYDQAKFAK
jgi:hypothetical protein